MVGKGKKWVQRDKETRIENANRRGEFFFFLPQGQQTNQ